jgi:ATP-binding cassette subfamily B protein
VSQLGTLPRTGMDEGQLVEAGKHEELLLRRGIYAELVRAQVEKTGRLE